ncbi:hypothetical protein Tco_0272318 [Tanacetum coccineum]
MRNDETSLGVNVLDLGLIITNLDVIGVIEDVETFGKLSDKDAVRLCLLLALEVIFIGRLLIFKVDDTLFRFRFLSHLKDVSVGGSNDPKVIPRALGWSTKSIFKRSDYSYLFAKESRSTLDLRPTIAEYESSWWIHNNLEKSRKRGNTCFRVTSSVCTNDNSVRKKWLNDLVIRELNFRVFKLKPIIQFLAHERSDGQAKLQFNDEFSSMSFELCDSLNSLFLDLIHQHDLDEDIAQDYLLEEELRLCLEEEERLHCEHEKLIVEEKMFRLEEPNRLRLEEEKMLQLAKEKNKNQKEFMNSTHVKNIFAKVSRQEESR